MNDVSVLFVCLGNICRSPLAEGVFRHIIEQQGLSDRVTTDSAGTGGWHTGEAPDRRSIAVAARYGLDLTTLKARQINKRDFQSFDLILGMDSSNIINIRRVAPEEARGRVHLFSTLTLGETWDVPDPYYGDASDFERVYHMISEGCMSLAERLKSSDMSASGNTSSVR